MGKREVNYPDILRKNSRTHICLCNSPVKIDLKVYNNTTRNDINHEMIQASSAPSHKHLWNGKPPSDQYSYGTWEQFENVSIG